MNEQENNTSAAFMEVTSRKLDAQDKKTAALEELIKSIPNYTEQIQRLIGIDEELRNEVKSSSLPTEKVQDLSSKLDLSNSLHKLPVKKEIYHDHHIPKIILVSVGLFIILTFVCSGWFITSARLDGYIANDTKYRQLRLDTSLESLQNYLDRVDSLYDARPDMREIVIETEERNRKNFERLERAEKLKEEAGDLERAAKKK